MTDRDGTRLAIGSEDCRPMLPENYNFYNVSGATLPLYPDYQREEYESLDTFGGRNRTTIVFTAVYNDGDDSDPDVQYLCLEMRDPAGELLPPQTLLREQWQYSAAHGVRKSVMLFGLAAAGITALVLQMQ